MSVGVVAVDNLCNGRISKLILRDSFYHISNESLFDVGLVVVRVELMREQLVVFKDPDLLIEAHSIVPGGFMPHLVSSTAILLLWQSEHFYLL